MYVKRERKSMLDIFTVAHDFDSSHSSCEKLQSGFRKIRGRVEKMLWSCRDNNFFVGSVSFLMHAALIFLSAVFKVITQLLQN